MYLVLGTFDIILHIISPMFSPPISDRRAIVAPGFSEIVKSRFLYYFVSLYHQLIPIISNDEWSSMISLPSFVFSNFFCSSFWNNWWGIKINFFACLSWASAIELNLKLQIERKILLFICQILLDCNIFHVRMIIHVL